MIDRAAIRARYDAIFPQGGECGLAGAATKTDAGLEIACGLDEQYYPKGIKVAKAALKNLSIIYDNFHGDWNYTIKPKKSVAS